MGGRPNETSFGPGQLLNFLHLLYLEQRQKVQIPILFDLNLLFTINAVSEFNFSQEKLLLDLETKGLIVNVGVHPVLNILPFIPGKDTLKYPEKVCILVYLCCHNKINRLDGLNSKYIFTDSSAIQKSKIEVPAILFSGEVSLSGFLPVLSHGLSACVEKEWSSLIIRTQVPPL